MTLHYLDFSVYYPQKTSTFQPIYESLSNRDIYSQVHKKPSNAEELKKCDTDSAALDRLSQLLTSKEQSEVSVKTDLISLHDNPNANSKNAPIASQDESLSSNPEVTEKPDNNKVFQELDEAFTELDQELAKNDLLEDEEKKLRIVSAPTAI